jgi:transposase
MPPQRRILQELDQNVRRGPNLTIAQRNQIIGMLHSGATVAEAANAYGRTERCIRNLKKKHNITGTTQDRPRSGRPPMLSLHQKKIIYRKARTAPKIEYSALAEVAVLMNPEGTPSKAPSRTTLWRLLKRKGLTNCRCKKRPKLNAKHAQERMKFQKRWRRFPWGRRTVKFSDECSIQKGSGSNNEWCFRFPWEKWKKEMLTECSTSRKPAQMVWGSVWLDERGRPHRSELVIMDRDSDAPKGGYSAKSYIEALTKGLLPYWRRSQYFMQDNAGIHRSHAVAAFLLRHHIQPIVWPAYSPDLNPIEHLWWVLKKLMYKHYPQFNNLSKAQEEWDGFCEALRKCWQSIPGKLIKRLILSMPARLAAVRKAHGWQTKY